MKNFTFLLSILLFFNHLASGQHSTQGKDFWLSFGDNYNRAPFLISLQVRVVATKATNVRFTFTETGTSTTVPLSAGSVYTRELSQMENPTVCSAVAGTSRKSLQIQSDEDISVYAITLHSASTDATAILPTASLNLSYYHLSYLPDNQDRFDGYTVVATQDSTMLYSSGLLVATLNRGGVYTHHFSANTDGTGTYVTANRPVAYFTTNSCVLVPLSIRTCDCLYEQLFPETLWGTSFIAPVTIRGVERLRVLASQNGTTITHIGGTRVSGSLNLNAGQFVELEIYASESGCYIEANKPVAVVSYLTGTTHANLTYPKGDPAMTWVPSVEQLLNEATIAPFVASGSSMLTEHHILIVSRTGTKNLTEIKVGNGAYLPLWGGIWADHTSGYSFYSMPLTQDSLSYSFKNSSGLAILGYGLGTSESYYYLASSALRRLDAAWYVNGVHHQDLDGQLACGNPIGVKAAVNYKMDAGDGHVKWLIDSFDVAHAKDSLAWDVVLPSGLHNISMIVKSEFGYVDTITASFSVLYNINVADSIAICANQLPYAYGDTTFEAGTTSGSYVLRQALTNGCDSIVTLALTVHPAYLLADSRTICDNQLPYAYRDSIFAVGTTSGTYTFRRKTVNGCDSIVNLTLTVNQTYQIADSKTLCDNQLPYAYGDTIFDASTTSGTYTFYRKTLGDCDSIVSLSLTVYPAHSDTDRQTICDNQLPYAYRDTIFAVGTTSGTYTLCRKTVNGCDSIVTLILTVNPTYHLADSKIFCEDLLPFVYADTTFINGTSSGIYTFRRKTTCGCDSVVALNLTVNQTPQIIVPDSLFACFGATATIAATTTAATIAWYKDKQHSEQIAQSASFQTRASSAETFYIAATSTAGCVAHSAVNLAVGDSLHLLPPTLPLYKSGERYAQPLEINAGQIHSLLIDGNLPPWLQHDNSGRIFGSPPRSEDNSYTFTVRIEDAFGCAAERQYTLATDALFLPDVFSPNGDGINDHFKKGYQLLIFDRLGKQLFEGNDGWNGTHNGRLVPNDTYFYIIYYTGADGHKARKSGAVTVQK